MSRLNPLSAYGSSVTLSSAEDGHEACKEAGVYIDDIDFGDDWRLDNVRQYAEVYIVLLTSTAYLHSRYMAIKLDTPA